MLPGPAMHIMTSKSGMLSKDGRCYTFDQRANGFVPGEGIGVILLKRFADAVRDGDQIHGVIKGWGVNQDGKTNGITAPSVNSQIALEKGIYERFHINPETITLVEAHGTGTKLGDPIEVEALTESFRIFTDKKNYCALGSVKSNIGHLLAAAGISGVIKVLLSLHQKMLPPTIHFEKLNQHISLKNSPFYINSELQRWKAPLGMPRRACVSSFGFSGTNAHVVIEEYSSPKTQVGREAIAIDSSIPVIIPLSAKNRDRLTEYAENLLKFIQRRNKTDSLNSPVSQKLLNLADLAYTLQIGREAMEERLGLIVCSGEELEEKLKRFIESSSKEGGSLCRPEEIQDLYLGCVEQNNETLAVFAVDEELQEAVNKWIGRKKFSKLLDFWVKGLTFDWNKLYEGTQGHPNKPQRISVPTYPFSRERYWVKTQDSDVAGNANSGMKSQLHPLLQENTSDFSRQRFSSTFSGEEFFLKDHQLEGEKVLPGVAYLEMAQEAVKRVSGDYLKENIQLKNVVWARPITVNKLQKVHIGLFPEENGEIAYEIYTDNLNATPGDDSEESTMHSQGRAVLSSSSEESSLNLADLQKKLNKNSLSPQACYKSFKTLGMNYGPAHQGLEKIYVGDNEVLAKLTLPASVTETNDQFTLHPSILDSALQASMGIDFSKEELNRAYGSNGTAARISLPFALESLNIKENCTKSMWAWVRLVQHSGSNGRAVLKKEDGYLAPKLDVDLCDEEGKVCVMMRGFSSRVFEGKIPEKSKANGALILKPIWKEKPGSGGGALDSLDSEQTLAKYTDRRVFLCDLNQCSQQLQDKINDILRASLSHVSITDLKSNEPMGVPSAIDPKNLGKRFEDYSLQLFNSIQESFQEKTEGGIRPRQGNILIQVLVPDQGPEQVFTGLSGLLKTARLENPRILGQVIAVKEEYSIENLIAKLQENSKFPEDQQIRYESDSGPEEKRLVASLGEIGSSTSEKRKSPLSIPWKVGGVYLITGGAGKLGLIFAKEIVEKLKSEGRRSENSPGVTLVLTGRSELGKQVKLKELEGLGAKIEYKSVDVSDKKAVEALTREIRNNFGALNGIIHSAGVI